MDNLVKLLKLHGLCGPDVDGHELVSVSCKCEFEPLGVYERWALVWRIDLLTVHHYTRDTRAASGWRRSESDACMTFKGLTLEAAVERATAFIRGMAAEGLPVRETWGPAK